MKFRTELILASKAACNHNKADKKYQICELPFAVFVVSIEHQQKCIKKNYLLEFDPGFIVLNHHLLFSHSNYYLLKASLLLPFQDFLGLSFALCPTTFSSYTTFGNLFSICFLFSTSSLAKQSRLIFFNNMLSQSQVRPYSFISWIFYTLKLSFSFLVCFVVRVQGSIKVDENC